MTYVAYGRKNTVYTLARPSGSCCFLVRIYQIRFLAECRKNTREETRVSLVLLGLVECRLGH